MANPLNIWNNPYTQDIVKGHSQAMYEGPNAIVNTTSGGLDYHTRANADLSNRISSGLTESGNPIAAGVYDFMAPAGAFGASLGYDLGQGVTRYGEKPGDYLSDFQQDVKSWQDNPDLDKGVKSALAGKGITDYSGVDLMGTTNAWMDEKPFSAAFGRMLGAAEPLANRLGLYDDDEKGIIDPSDPRFNQAGIGIISGLNKLFGPKIASYLKNKAITKGAQKIRGPKTKPPTKTPTPSGWHPGVGGNGGGGGQQGRPDRGRSRGAGETGQIAGGHHFNLGGLARLLYYGGLV